MIAGQEPNMSVGASEALRQMETTQTRSHSVAPKLVLSDTKDKIERTIVLDEPMSEKEETPFLPYSGQSVFGLDNHEQYSEHMIQSNFHARLIHKMENKAVFCPDLDMYLQCYMKQRLQQGSGLQELDQRIQITFTQLEKLRAQRSKLPAQSQQGAFEQEEQLKQQIKELLEQQTQQNSDQESLVKTIFDLSQEEQGDLFELHQVPMREGGIDYDEQASLYTEMNETLAELLNKTQAQNQNLISQILKESPSQNDLQDQYLESQRSQTENVARQRHLWLQQRGQATMNSTQHGGSALPTVQAIQNLLNSDVGSNQTGNRMHPIFQSSMPQCITKPQVSQGGFGLDTRGKGAGVPNGSQLGAMQKQMSVQASMQRYNQGGAPASNFSHLNNSAQISSQFQPMQTQSRTGFNHLKSKHDQQVCATDNINHSITNLSHGATAVDQEAIQVQKQLAKLPDAQDAAAMRLQDKIGDWPSNLDTPMTTSQRLVSGKNQMHAQAPGAIAAQRMGQVSSNEGSDLIGSNGNFEGGWYDGGPDSGAGGLGHKPKKRIRRTANEINRRFVCICGKAYGSEGSLNQHRKNKGHYEESKPGQNSDSGHGLLRDPQAYN